MPTSWPRAAGHRWRAASARDPRITSCTSTRRESRRCGTAAVTATLLPAAAFYLKLGRFAPARDADRCRRARRARDRHQPGRRVLAVDAVRDGAGLLRDEDDARGSARRRHAERRVVARRLRPGRQHRARQAVRPRPRATGTSSTSCASGPGPCAASSNVAQVVFARKRVSPCRSLIDGSVRDLIDAFASPAPTPGGGSASALAGAVGASLLLMMSRMPKTRAGTDAERETLARWSAPLDDARSRLTALVDEDSAAYDAVVAAFRQPKSTDEEKAARTGGDSGRDAAGDRGPARRHGACRLGACRGGGRCGVRQPERLERRACRDVACWRPAATARSRTWPSTCPGCPTR